MNKINAGQERKMDKEKSDKLKGMREDSMQVYAGENGVIILFKLSIGSFTMPPDEAERLSEDLKVYAEQARRLMKNG